MTNSKIKRTWSSLQLHVNKNIQKISKENNNVDWSKEELIINRLEEKLGKSREDITKIISRNLLSLLTMVPFNMNK